MWPSFVIVVLFVLKLTHVNTQDDDFYFGTTTSEVPVEKEVNIYFDTTTSEVPVEEESKKYLETTTSEVPVEEEVNIYFDTTTTEVPVEEESKNYLETTTSEVPVEEEVNIYFDTTTSEVPVDEELKIYLETTTSEVPVEEEVNIYFDTTTTEVPVEEESKIYLETTTSEVPVEEEVNIYFDPTTSEVPVEGEIKMSEYILKVIEHYKQPDPEGWPGAKIPDPFFVPDSSQFLAFGTNLDFTNTTLHGVNKFRVVYINADIGEMECRAAFEMNELQVRGKYSLNTWLSSYPGGFVSNISGIRSEVLTTLGVEEDGKLRAQNISIDITFKNITIQFENAGILATMLQGIFNSMGSILYDSIKSYLLDDAQTNMREDINKKLDKIVGDIEFPNTISPMDMVLVDVRKKIKDMKMDPLKIDDYCTNIGIFKIALKNTWIKGLSTFHRVGNVKIRLENHTAVSDFNIGTKELQGSTSWEVSGINGVINKTGSVSFSIAYIQGRFVLAQDVDTRKKIEFRDLQLDVGNIQIGSDGMGTLDYIIELLANILPTLLRYQIIGAIENPIRWKIQQELDRINIEEAIVNELPKIDKMQEDGFQLAELRMIKSTDEIYFDDDEFFNF